ncbi:MAG: peptidylprolyl isomerase [Solirubrobacteraceae bacterium]
MRKLIILMAAAAIGLAGCGGSASSTASPGFPATTTASVQAAASSLETGHCRTVAAPRPRGPQHLTAPSYSLDPAKTYIVSVSTNCGSFAIKLDVKAAPNTTASFYSLVKRGFYDGLMFQRVATGFVIQGGDPYGNGTGGPGYTVVEAPPKNLQYVRGTVAMAKTEAQPAGASGSQFFIVTTANATTSDGLTPDYALVGEVVSGLNVVEAIGSLPTSPTGDDMPIPPVVMSRVTVSVS